MKYRVSEESKKIMDAFVTSDLSISEIARRADVSFGTASRYVNTKRYLLTQAVSADSQVLKDTIDMVFNHNYRTAKNAGFISSSDYEKSLREKRKSRQPYVIFSRLFNDKLAELNITQSKLAKLLDITESAVSRYASGYSYPKKEIQKILFPMLFGEKKTIDDITDDRK